MKVSLLRMAAAIFIFAACTSEVLGSIPPSQFHFQTVVSKDKDKPSGWRAAQVVITLGSRYGVVACQVEVGVPFMTLQGGRISEESAQVAAATAANEAARVVLADPTATMMSATLCIAFLEEMKARLQVEIPGARVSRFKSVGLTPSHWP